MTPISMISALKLGLRHRLNLVLILLGLRIVSRVDIYERNDSVASIKQALQTSGLFFYEMETTANKKHLCRLVVSKTKIQAMRFVRAANEQNYKEMLSLQGLPETAVLASTNLLEQLPQSEYPNDLIIHNPLVFTLSKAGKDNEIEIIRREIQAIKEEAPDLYAELVKEDIVV